MAITRIVCHLCVNGFTVFAGAWMDWRSVTNQKRRSSGPEVFRRRKTAGAHTLEKLPSISRCGRGGALIAAQGRKFIGAGMRSFGKIDDFGLILVRSVVYQR